MSVRLPETDIRIYFPRLEDKTKYELTVKQVEFFINLNQFICASCSESTFLRKSVIYITFIPWRFTHGSCCPLRGEKWRLAQQLSATALFPWQHEAVVWRHGNDALADDTCCAVWRRRLKGMDGLVLCTGLVVSGY